MSSPPRSVPRPLLLAAFVALAVPGCTPEPREVRIGIDECALCRMTVSEPAFAAQLLTVRGRSYVFDSVECLAGFLADGGEVAPDQVGSLWVTDFTSPGEWIPAEEATFLLSDGIRSPMGAGLTAFASRSSAEELRGELGGRLLPWTEVRDHVDAGAELRELHRSPQEEGGARGEIRVGPGERHETLAGALEAAEEGGTIRLLAGTYRESGLEIRVPSLRLLGDGGPVVDGGGEGTILTVRADGVEVRGITFRNTGISMVRDHSAILVEESRGCVVEGNRLEDNFFGIYLARVEECRVTDNRIRASGERETRSGNGVHLWNSRGITVEGNHIQGHRDGIYLEFAREARVRGNRVEDNLRYGMHFMFSDESVYSENLFRRNGAGVAVMYTENVRMHSNRFEDNWGPASYGLLLKEVKASRIEENLFRRNTTAIHSDGSDGLLFRRNRLVQNGWAVKVMASSQDNRFVENDFIDNTFEVTTNSRRSYNTFDGNHWSQYRGYDLEGDGVGDVPHRPVRLFSFIVQRQPAAMILLRSFFIDLLEVAERVLPVLTPEALVDENPRMREITAVRGPGQDREVENPRMREITR